MSDVLRLLRFLGYDDEANIVEGFHIQRANIQEKVGTARDYDVRVDPRVQEQEKNAEATVAAGRVASGLRADGPKVTMGQERLAPVSLGVFDFRGLQQAVDARARHIDPEGVLGPLFFATELGGETGEALNVVKKLERERLGIPGRRDDKAHLAKELGDAIVTCCNVARHYNIDLHTAIVEVFNRVSAERHLPVLLK